VFDFRVRADPEVAEDLFALAALGAIAREGFGGPPSNKQRE
jgi:hypothetical protein